MTLKWNGVIQRKLALMDQQVMRLEGHLRDVSREQFVQDWAMRTISERAIQVCVEIMIDIAERIIAFAGAGPTATATEAIDRLHSTAMSHGRIIVVEIMGHRAGWLALGAGLAGGADVILIPEIPYQAEKAAKERELQIKSWKKREAIEKLIKAPIV